MAEGELVVSHLSKRWPNGVSALEDVSFTVPRGQFVAVLGPSGAGKSTLLRCINRLIEPSEGKIVFDGIDITALPSKEMTRMRRRIGFIFQHFNIIDTYTVRQNVMAGRIGHNPLWRNLLQTYRLYDEAVVERYIRRVDLFDKIDERTDTLSGGQQQRVAIARAAAQEPDIILADEPMASLDPKLARVVLDLLAELAKERAMTVMVNLHVLELALAYGDRIIALNNGQLVFDGSPDELTEDIVTRIYADTDEDRPY